MNFGDPRLPERFWSKCMPEPNSGCWLWFGATSSTGYGNFMVKSYVFAHPHRHAYLTLVGDVAAGLHLDHLCRVPCCVNPAHLEPVTPRENSLRGDAVFNGEHHRIKTHCRHGHPYSGDNLYISFRNGRPKRGCRACNANKARAARERRARAEASEAVFVGIDRNQNRCAEHHNPEAARRAS